MVKLIVVESKAKIDTIMKILGKDYVVEASYGIFKDLDKRKMSIDVNNNFEPNYIIVKPEIVFKLRNAYKGTDMLYIASDLDNEGEGIAQSIYDVLKPREYYRLRFNSITKSSLLNAINNPGKIDQNLVDTQKCRRILDRLYGYTISPIVKQKVGGSSAGRVQSVVTRLVVDKEEEINKFITHNENTTFFKVRGLFNSNLKATLYKLSDEQGAKCGNEYKGGYKGGQAKIDLDPNSKNKNQPVIDILNECLQSKFKIHDISERETKRYPSAPFDTSTLQQDANRKFGLSVDSTMKIAQALYEAGYITYMRTDSVNISKEGHEAIKKTILSEYGEKHYKYTVYKNKLANAQEAHEAIRPTHPEYTSLEGKVKDELQLKLYKLIWQRTMACQMNPANINVTDIQISISKYLQDDSLPKYYFQSSIENIIYPGYMMVYTESKEDVESDEFDINSNFKGDLPEVDSLIYMNNIEAKQEYLKPPVRYSQASLVKKMKTLGIGRPATYASAIGKILSKKYVEIKDIKGINKQIYIYTICSDNNNISEHKSNIQIGKESKKLVPTSMGLQVTKFLLDNFQDMMDYKFTAGIEDCLSRVAEGSVKWYEIVKDYYDILMKEANNAKALKSLPQQTERLVGNHNGVDIFALKTKVGDTVVRKKEGSKFVYANVDKPFTLDTITLAEAIKLFEYPKILGVYNDKDVILKKWKDNTFFLNYDGKNFSLDNNKVEPDFDLAVATIEKINSNILAEYNLNIRRKDVKVQIVQGPKAIYIKAISNGKAKNNWIPKEIDPYNITTEQIIEILTSSKPVKSSKPKFKKASCKKAAAKKAVKS